jgi:PAS domain S-box-containing protein
VTRTTGDWVWEVDAEGRYVYASPMVEQVLGYRPEQVVGRRYTDFLSSDGGDDLAGMITDIFRRKKPFVKLIGAYVHASGRQVVLQTTGLPLLGPAGELLGYRGAHRDVTAERQLEERLEGVHLLGEELVLTRDELEVAGTVVDAARLLIQCYLCAVWLLDESGETLVRRAFWAARPVSSAAQLPVDDEGAIVAAVARSGEMICVTDATATSRYVDVGIGNCTALCVPLRVEERIIGAFTVASAHPNAFGPAEQQVISTLAAQTSIAIENARLYQAVEQQRERLRALTMRLTETEEIERKNLARELHDQVGQNLTAIGINLNILEAQMPPATRQTLQDRMEDSKALLQQTTKRIRNVMADLQPPVLEDYGLVAALRWYGTQFAARSGINVSVYGEDELIQRLPASVESTLFRVVQEALNNVAKHAQASQVTVSVEFDAGIVRLIVADDGIGFDPAQAARPDARRGWGLLTMAERVEALGGHFSVESRPHSGARVIVEVTK